MALCVNDSGTWREIPTLCVNDSGTWREISTGCINDSGTWREFGFAPDIAGASLGDNIEGGYLICKSSGVGWIVAPASTEVSRNWFNRDDAVTTAQADAACGDWYIPTIGQLQNPGYLCSTYWDSYSSGGKYWSSTGFSCPFGSYGCFVWFHPAGGPDYGIVHNTYCVRAFRCVTY